METDTKTENTNGNVNNVRILSREEDALYDGITIDSEDIDENNTYNKTYKTADYLKNFNISSNSFVTKIVLGLIITGIILFILFIALPIALVVLGVLLTVWLILSFFQKR